MRLGRLLLLAALLGLMLLGATAGWQSYQRQVFGRMLRRGNWRVVKARLEHGADPHTTSANGTTPLMLAAAAGDLEAIRWLLDRRVQINAWNQSGSTALSWAAGAGQMQAVRLLLDRGAAIKLDPHGSDPSPRYAAFVGGHKAVHQELQRREVLARQLLDPGLYYRYPRSVLRKKVRSLLDAGAPINAYDMNGTALRHAAGTRDLELALLLRRRGCDPNLQDLAHLTFTPLDVAVFGRDAAMVRLLLAHRADPNGPSMG